MIPPLSRCLAALLPAVLLVGCALTSPEWEERMHANRENLLMLELGMTPREVLLVMGDPSLNEAYVLDEDRTLRVYFYYTNRMVADGNETKEEMTPVVFENGRLVGWGEEYYRSYSIEKMEIRSKY